MFFKDWFENEPEVNFKNCKIIKLTEIPESRESIHDKLIETVIHNYSDPDRIKSYLKDEKYSNLERYINRRIPNVPIHRKGDFGEIFGTEHLKQVHGYVFPVTKLRVKFDADESLKKEDILGFFIEEGNITRICVGESKVRSNSDSSALNDAMNQLKKSYNPHPVLLKFFSDTVYGFDEELAEKIEDLMSIEVFSEVEKDNWIYYITGFKPRKFNIDNTSGELSNLFLVHVYFSDLNEFIDNVFDSCRGHYNKE